MADGQDRPSWLDEFKSDLALDKRVTALEFQVGRLISHLESEVSGCRDDMTDLRSKLFGKDDEIYSGRMGELLKRVHNMQVSFWAIAAGASIVGFMILIYQFLIKQVDK